MDIQEKRRENLRRWVTANGVPPDEKSYFSQLLSGSASFGERSARRLERVYRMGEGYLEQSIEVGKKISHLSAVKNHPEEQILTTGTDEIIELLALFQQSTIKGRQFILKSARAAEKRFAARWIRANDES
jgi:hypothetical protein